MKLYEQFAEKNFHTSIATTFGVDFDAYESIVLPRLNGAGCRNNIIISDARMLTHALGGASALPKHAGKLYTINGANAQGIFHPKLFLQFGRRGARLLVGSANLTATGLAGNLEIVASITCDETDTGEQRLVAQAWEYVSHFIDNRQQSQSRQCEWMIKRTPWLSRATAASGPIRISDGTSAALLTTDEPEGIASGFANLTDGAVSRLIVISPYWDMELEALRLLADRMEPSEISVLIDPDSKAFPKNAMRKLPPVRLYDSGNFHSGRFIHAKAIIAQTTNADHVLIGSANCTKYALGANGVRHTNEEVCLYRRLPPNSILETLRIRDLLDSGSPIDPDSLDEPEIGEDLPLSDLAKRTPGQFECYLNTLIWFPANNVGPSGWSIEILDHQNRVLPCRLSQLPGDRDHVIRFEIIEAEERPAFARVAYPDGSRSAIAIVSLIDHIRAVARETRSREAENALRELDSETEVSLALLDVLDVLEKLEGREKTVRSSRSASKTRSRQKEPTAENHYQVLSYREFIAGRRPRTSGVHIADNSFAGSDASVVRGFLNRIVGLRTDNNNQDDEDEDSLKKAFDMGDETADAQASVAAGEEFDTERDSSRQKAAVDLERRRKAARKATKEQIASAVGSYIDRIKACHTNDTLDNYDVLRLRALLMIICAAALPRPDFGNGKTGRHSRLQVLPAEDDERSWPKLIGRLIFVVFGGNQPPINDLCVSSDHDQIPDDYIECWATCYWCLHACLAAPLSPVEHAWLKKHVKRRLNEVCQSTLPTKDELLGDDVIALMERMSAQYAERLGIGAEAIVREHRAFVTELFLKEE